MKKYVCLLLGLFATTAVFAQQDTVAYSAQRVKVNGLLTDRSKKFGQYDESLNQRTGIFGWQTKKDIKRSNEILRDVVLTDNNIFKELKVLMEYKDLQNQQKLEVADHSQERLDNYMLSIKKLQDQNAELKQELKNNSKSGGTMSYIFIILLLILVGIIYFMYKKLQQTKSQRLSQNL
ncbi:hypothetical protein ACJVDH_08685 [Pedobacter sp. AW1-32]|uniref:hypothetical protein n=1 Tax=Pedobacter sp. AW1-32 TaxID=3383026 RepID=UPI003FED9EC9